ncbi:hypothetical protein FHL15_006911 [Xylaria flabelliformis]|uniref:Uncharacterized protein n=1 Tax=Xylaria flabelliformis TaxID=2512241 RepID=A0A553HWH3_9PEZI|nr:hypothetical protein FHL15_006911 [Xylaria flabelliformis]
MRSSREAVRGIQWLQPRGLTAPAACYDPCNNASLEAQSIGKIPELCAPDSAFFRYYDSCASCIDASDSGQETTKDYLDSTFGEWIDYCNGSAPAVSPISTLSGVEHTVTILYTTTIDGQKTVTFFAPIPDTTVITIETTQDGHSTVWTSTKTFTHLPSEGSTSGPHNSSSSTATQETSEATTTSPTDIAESKSIPRNRTWVAGPVVGGVAGIVILLVVAWVVLRAKRNRNGKKHHELHGESAIKSELEVKLRPQELDGREQKRQPVELPGNVS